MLNFEEDKQLKLSIWGENRKVRICDTDVTVKVDNELGMARIYGKVMIFLKKH